MGIASGARNPVGEFCRRKNSGRKPAMPFCGRARRIIEKETEIAMKVKKETSEAGVKKKALVSGGGGPPDQYRQFYPIRNTKQQF
jgi:hypothetical protein